jgi:hypothetical protein
VGRLERTTTGTLPIAIPITEVAPPEKAVTSGTFVALWALTFPRVTRGLQVQVAVRADAGTLGEVVVTDAAGATLATSVSAVQAPLPVPGTGSVQTTATLAVPPGPVGALVTLHIRARRTSGSGNVYVSALAAAGIPAGR